MIKSVKIEPLKRGNYGMGSIFNFVYYFLGNVLNDPLGQQKV